MSKIEEIKKRLEEPEHIEKKATILFDGRQFMVKIPREIASIFDMEKGQKLVFDVKIPLDNKAPIIPTFRVEDAKKD